MPERPDVLTPTEVADWCRVSTSTVLGWTRDGILDRLPTRRVRITRASVERLLDGGYDGDDLAWRRLVESGQLDGGSR